MNGFNTHNSKCGSSQLKKAQYSPSMKNISAPPCKHCFIYCSTSCVCLLSNSHDFLLALSVTIKSSSPPRLANYYTNFSPPHLNMLPSCLLFCFVTWSEFFLLCTYNSLFSFLRCYEERSGTIPLLWIGLQVRVTFTILLLAEENCTIKRKKELLPSVSNLTVSRAKLRSYTLPQSI